MIEELHDDARLSAGALVAVCMAEICTCDLCILFACICPLVIISTLMDSRGLAGSVVIHLLVWVWQWGLSRLSCMLVYS